MVDSEVTFACNPILFNSYLVRRKATLPSYQIAVEKNRIALSYILRTANHEVQSPV